MYDLASYDWQASHIHCACTDCEFADNGIPFDVDVIRTKGALPVLEEGGVRYLDWVDQDGYPHITAAFFYHGDEEGSCFSELLDGVSEAKSDWLPETVLEELMSCDVCGSSIAARQPIILASSGRLVLPARRPPGRVVARFEETHEEFVLCLNCVRMANDINSSPVWRGKLHEEDCDWTDG